MNYTDEIGATAWWYLLDEVKRLPAGKLSVNTLHERLASWMHDVPNSAHEADGCLWEFCNDLVDAVVEDIRDETEESDYYLGSEKRHRVAYTVLKYYLLDKSVRVSKNLKREINSRAKEIGVSAEQAQALIQSLLPQMLEAVLDG